MYFDLPSYLTNYARYGESWFYLENVKGAAITTRSHAANIRTILVREEDTTGWKDELGVRLTISENGVWNVEEKSSVTTLTIAEGAAVNAAEMYVNCTLGEDGFLDASTGTLTDIAAGEYSNVVLTAAK